MPDTAQAGDTVIYPWGASIVVHCDETMKITVVVHHDADRDITICVHHSKGRNIEVLTGSNKDGKTTWVGIKEKELSDA